MPQKEIRYRFLVSVRVPKGVTRTLMTRYLREAIRGWQGGYEAEHPLFGAFNGNCSIGISYPPPIRKSE